MKEAIKAVAGNKTVTFTVKWSSIVAIFGLIGVTPVMDSKAFPQLAWEKIDAYIQAPTAYDLAQTLSLNNKDEIYKDITSFEFYRVQNTDQLDKIKEIYKDDPVQLQIEIEKNKRQNEKLEYDLQRKKRQLEKINKDLGYLLAGKVPPDQENTPN